MQDTDPLYKLKLKQHGEYAHVHEKIMIYKCKLQNEINYRKKNEYNNFMFTFHDVEFSLCSPHERGEKKRFITQNFCSSAFQCLTLSIHQIFHAMLHFSRCLSLTAPKRYLGTNRKNVKVYG